MKSTLCALLVIFLVFASAFASQHRSASLTIDTKRVSQADQNWITFWNSFRVAVRQRDIKAIAGLMDNPFYCGGELEAPAGCLKQMIRNDRQFWNRMDVAIKAGTKVTEAPSDKEALRVSLDKQEYLSFALTNGKWTLWQIGETL